MILKQIISGLLFLLIILLVSISHLVEFIFIAFIIFFQLFVFVPLIYFKTKRPIEENIQEINIHSLERIVGRNIEKKIFTYELRGFKPLSLLELPIDTKSKIYLQVMTNTNLNVSLALFYGVNIDKDLKFREITIEYVVFEFEDINKKLIQITNNIGNKLPTSNGINQYFINDDDFLSELILDISKKGLINKNSDTFLRIQNNVLLSTQEDSINQRDYLLKLNYFIQKGDYITLSIKASFTSTFKETYPLNKFFNFLESEKSKKYFESKEIFLDSYSDESFREENYDKKINSLKTLEEYFNTNNKYLEIAKQHQIEKIQFTFDDDFDDIIHISIEFTAQKKVSKNRCLYSNTQININNENKKTLIYYEERDIRLYKYERLNPIIGIDKCVEIKQIQKRIHNQYKEASIVEISLEMFDNTLSYIVLVYKLKIDKEPITIYLNAITGKILREE